MKGSVREDLLLILIPVEEEVCYVLVIKMEKFQAENYSFTYDLYRKHESSQGLDSFSYGDLFTLRYYYKNIMVRNKSQPKLNSLIRFIQIMS